MSAESYSFDKRNRTPLSASNKEPARPKPGPDWKQELREAVRDLDELAGLLELPRDRLDAIASPDFPLLVPRSFVARMRKRDLQDPLLRQVLPSIAETRRYDGFSGDPLREHALARNGCLQKYAGRVLLVLTAACPVHCRYCFRREFPYAEQAATRAGFEPALATIRNTAGVTEVILSGGDPLSLTNEKLADLVGGIEDIPGVRTLRIHTRFPIVLPARIDPGLTRLLSGTRMQTVVVVHANHAAEIDDSVVSAARELKQATDLLLNQSVLLRGINDDAESLVSLSERLHLAGILPYYLHVLDRVAGAGHFEVGDADAARLVAAIRHRLPGYLVPRLVRELPGELSKTPVY